MITLVLYDQTEKELIIHYEFHCVEGDRHFQNDTLLISDGETKYPVIVMDKEKIIK